MAKCTKTPTVPILTRAEYLALPEWRCTRPDLYTAPGCPGQDPSGRQGHYIRAASEADARAEMQRRYPGERIDVQPWGPPVKLAASA